MFERQRRVGWALALFLAAAALMPRPAGAAPLPSGSLEQRCWLEHSRERTRVNLREPTAVEFALLRDGMRVRSPFAVDFAVRGKGVAPAGVVLQGTGHHHILVNRDLPLDVRAKLPFDDSHRHFGKGQTGTALDLPAGRHRLRLLFADHEHRPFYVYSREITVEVLGPRSSTPRPRIDPARFAETCAAWHDDLISTPPAPDEPLRFVNVREGETLVSPFNLRLGVDRLGVCSVPPPGIAQPPDTGRFIVEVDSEAGRRVQTFDLKNGATQVNLFVPAGNYTLRLRFVGAEGRELLPAQELPVRVLRQEAL
jgi:hypothetical protein